MNVEIVSAIDNPLDIISIVAGTSYGKGDVKHNRVVTCFDNGHDSVFEHAVVTFKVFGISRTCSHQLVRHRMASYCQVSHRYTKVDIDNDDWYVTPPYIEADGTMLTAYKYDMYNAALGYKYYLTRGVKPEDARYVLPEATKTDIMVTMNVRELFHFLDLRTDSHAQWEIRDMAWKIAEAVEGINGQWSDLIGLWKQSNHYE